MPALFISVRGARLGAGTVHDNFPALVRAARLQAARTAAAAASRPAPQLRGHPLGWYRDGADVQGSLPALSTYLGHVDPADTYWYLHGGPRAARPGRRSASSACEEPAVSALAPTLEAFFTERLIRQRQASPHTIAAYRDTLPAAAGLRRRAAPASRPRTSTSTTSTPRSSAPSSTTSKHERGNSVRTRNARLAAIHSLFRFAALAPPRARRAHPAGARDPAQALRPRPRDVPHPTTRSTRCSPPRTAPPGSADATTPCCSLAVQTGLRVSELTGLRCRDVDARHRAPTSAATARAARNGARRSPPRPSRVLRAWLRERDGRPAEPLFPSRSGGPLSRDAVAGRSSPSTPHRRRSAARRCATKTVTPHVLRHTSRDAPAPGRRRHLGDRPLARPRAASRRPRSTSTPISRSRNGPSPAPRPLGPPPGRYRPPDPLLAFLDSL